MSGRRFWLRALGAAAVGLAALGLYVRLEKKVGVLARISPSLAYLALPFVAALAIGLLTTPRGQERSDLAPVAGMAALTLIPGAVAFLLLTPRVVFPIYFAAALLGIGFVGERAARDGDPWRPRMRCLRALLPGVLVTILFGFLLTGLAAAGMQGMQLPMKVRRVLGGAAGGILFWGLLFTLLSPLTVWLGRRLEAGRGDTPLLQVRLVLGLGLLIPAATGFFGASDLFHPRTPFALMTWGGLLGAAGHGVVYAVMIRRG